jgi:spore coat-associated protein N
MSSSRRKVLVPLATLVAAGAIAVGSGATFSSESGNTISSVTTGSLTQANSKAGEAIFDLTNVKPGDTVNGYLTITNTGSLPAAFSLTESGSTNPFSDNGAGKSNLSLTITNTTTSTQVYAGDFGGLVDGSATDLGNVSAGAANEYKFSVKLAQGTPNADQGKTAGAVYTWNSVQLDAETFEQN